MSEWWLDDSVPDSWLYPDDERGEQSRVPSPAADALPEPPEPPQPPEPPWWLTDEVCGSPEEEDAAWLASLPADIRADYLDGPYTGAGEAIAAGFTHYDAGPSAAGFAAGGALDQRAPGPHLARALEVATGPGYHELSDSEQIGVLCAWQRQAAWAQAGLARAALAVARRREDQATAIRNPHLAEHVPDEIGAALTLTALSAGRLLNGGAGLDRLPEIDDALSTGRIDWARACVLIEELSVLPANQARDIAARLLAVGRLTTSQLRARLRREVLAADPGAAARRRKDGRKETRVEAWAEPSGNTVLAGRELRPADAITADAQLTADARWLRDHAVPGTLAELRAAAFITRLSGHHLASLLPKSPESLHQPPEAVEPSHDGHCSGTTPGGSINLTMPLSAFVGLDDKPGDAAGHGAIDAETCRELAARIAATARWCLTLTGADGRAAAHACSRRGQAPPACAAAITWAAGLRERLQFLESGTCRHRRQTAAYHWPASLRHLIEIRQPTCAAPCCRRPATHCDVDHTIPYDQGGRSCECNGAPLCRKHHRCKQAPGWGLTQDRPGSMIWLTPGGRAYATTGDPHPT